MFKMSKFALEVFRRYPQNAIFYIPVRLDDCKIPYEELKSIHHVDYFLNGMMDLVQYFTLPIERNST